eukprot:1120093-Rhodomonas_salina.1
MVAEAADAATAPRFRTGPGVLTGCIRREAGGPKPASCWFLARIRHTYPAPSLTRRSVASPTSSIREALELSA